MWCIDFNCQRTQDCKRIYVQCQLVTSSIAPAPRRGYKTTAEQITLLTAQNLTSRTAGSNNRGQGRFFEKSSANY